MTEISGELCLTLDTLLEADFFGRTQTLTLEQAEQRLLAALERRAQGRRGELSTAINEIERRAEYKLYFSTLSYRSVAYDAAGLTATLVRLYTDADCRILDAHMALMRSMILNEDEPNIQPLLEVLADLKSK